MNCKALQTQRYANLQKKRKKLQLDVANLPNKFSKEQ